MVVIAIPALIAFFLVVQPPLPDRHPPAAGRHRSGQGGAACDEHGRPLRRRPRSGHEARRLVRARDRRHRLPPGLGRGRPPPGGSARALVGLHRRRDADRAARGGRSDRPTRCSTTSGRCRAASRTSSRSSSPSCFERPSLVSAVARKRTTFSLKLRLLSEPGIVVTNVPLVSQRRRAAAEARCRAACSSRRSTPRRSAPSTTRGRSASRTRRPSSSRSTRTRRSESSETGSARALGLPLEIVEAPFRDLGDPLRGYLRELTADPDVAVSVVMPELVFNGVAQAPAQPARALHQAAAPLRAARPPVQRPLPPAVRILVAFDGSDASRRALVHAAELVGRGGSLDVINVIGAQPVSARIDALGDGAAAAASGRLLREARAAPRRVGSPDDARGGRRGSDQRDPHGRRAERSRRDRRRPRHRVAAADRRLRQRDGSSAARPATFSSCRVASSRWKPRSASSASPRSSSSSTSSSSSRSRRSRACSRPTRPGAGCFAVCSCSPRSGGRGRPTPG